ncbi:MAG: bis(5'-nucleosyl)-tetraphosphatase (symmetrical) YqeK [Eubacterium sp.]|nr:bis(5'-nucleosyl)-tetraphosphatase (symmetrical) YqeK [Eubacterium sp.]
MNTDFIEKYIADNFSEKRRIHTYGVRDTSMRLARKYGADPEKARACSLYHDMFRRATDEHIDECIEKYGLDPKYRHDPDLAHSKIAAIYMKNEMGIDDEDMLNAVAYHTTGRAGMSILEKVIFLADAIEPARDYPSVGYLRELAEEDLDEACLALLERSEDYLRLKGREMDPDSISFMNELRKKLKEEETEKKEMDNREIAMEAAKLLDQKKAQDVLVIDIAEKSSFADYLVLASAGSDRQAESLADNVEDRMAELGQNERLAEGRKHTGWVLLDFGDIIVNIFTAGMRDKYDLEKVWGDCETVQVKTEE